MNKPFIIGISAFAAALGYFLFKGTSLKETGDNIRVSLASLPKIHKIDLTGLKISAFFLFGAFLPVNSRF